MVRLSPAVMRAGYSTLTGAEGEGMATGEHQMLRSFVSGFILGDRSLVAATRRSRLIPKPLVSKAEGHFGFAGRESRQAALAGGDGGHGAGASCKDSVGQSASQITKRSRR